MRVKFSNRKPSKEKVTLLMLYTQRVKYRNVSLQKVDTLSFISPISVLKISLPYLQRYFSIHLQSHSYLLYEIGIYLKQILQVICTRFDPNTFDTLILRGFNQYML